MNVHETGDILDLLWAAYPGHYKNMGQQQFNSILKLWTDMFADDDAVLVGLAVKTIISTDMSGFPPTIGAVKTKMRELLQPEEMTEAEAWALVKKAVSRGYYNSKEEFNKLPKTLQRIVGSPAQLKEWSTIDTPTLESVISSNFQRSYKARAKQEKEYDAIPQDVKLAIGKIAEKLALGDGG